MHSFNIFNILYAFYLTNLLDLLQVQLAILACKYFFLAHCNSVAKVIKQLLVIYLSAPLCDMYIYFNLDNFPGHF